VSIPNIKKLFSFIRLYVTVILSFEVFLLSSKRLDFIWLNGTATKPPTCSFFALGENLVKSYKSKKYFFVKYPIFFRNNYKLCMMICLNKQRASKSSYFLMTRSDSQTVKNCSYPLCPTSTVNEQEPLRNKLIAGQTPRVR
jgi:hypothetical protein